MSDDDDYKVGYGNPPKHSQFQKGQSGNPNGRPKGSKNKRTEASIDRLYDLILEEAHRQVPLKQNGEIVPTEIATAVMRSITTNALRGNARSQALFFNLYEGAAQQRDEKHSRLLETAFNYKEHWRERFKLIEEENLPRVDVVPHPDDIRIDPETGDVTLHGPLTYEQREQEDLAMIAGFENEISGLKRRVNIAKAIGCKPEIIKLYEDDLESAELSRKKWQELLEMGRKSNKPTWTTPLK